VEIIFILIFCLFVVAVVVVVVDVENQHHQRYLADNFSREYNAHGTRQLAVIDERSASSFERRLGLKVAVRVARSFLLKKNSSRL
jgi:hypothetical protein